VIAEVHVSRFTLYPKREHFHPAYLRVVMLSLDSTDFVLLDTNANLRIMQLAIRLLVAPPRRSMIRASASEPVRRTNGSDLTRISKERE